ncbi:hypothetical protein BDQ17DRAFT_1435556 [Cyathus striatus]|nr:hypothetical protein BDQ17DRAFT_1435556 [Cyathus striatus]
MVMAEDAHGQETRGKRKRGCYVAAGKGYCWDRTPYPHHPLRPDSPFPASSPSHTSPFPPRPIHPPYQVHSSRLPQSLHIHQNSRAAWPKGYVEVDVERMAASRSIVTAIEATAYNKKNDGRIAKVSVQESP